MWTEHVLGVAMLIFAKSNQSAVVSGRLERCLLLANKVVTRIVMAVWFF